MTVFKKTVLEPDHVFDGRFKRHYLNGSVAVLHCHHFTALYSQLALDTGETGLLRDVAEDNFHPILVSYYGRHGIQELKDRISIAAQYFGAIGLGTLDVVSMGPDAGEVTLPVSHVDQGWIKKWGPHDRPVNYIGAGYIAAMFSACQDMPVRTFVVEERASIVTGAKQSVFKVVRK